MGGIFGGGGAIGKTVAQVALPAGVTNDYALGGGVGTLIVTTNAAGSTLNGMTAQPDGTQVVIINKGSGVLTLPYNSGNPAVDGWSFAGQAGNFALQPGGSALASYSAAIGLWSL